MACQAGAWLNGFEDRHHTLHVSTFDMPIITGCAIYDLPRSETSQCFWSVIQAENEAAPEDTAKKRRINFRFGFHQAFGLKLFKGAQPFTHTCIKDILFG
jgi:hypothetical protein